MRSALRSDVPLLEQTNASLLENGGKKLRPLLALLTARACGPLTQESLNYAAATELMHNATLLHDDVVDDSAERRGLPTVYSLLGGGPSVLIGDFWLVRCMQTILGAEHYSEEVIRIYSKTLSDLAEGELLQMQKAASADTTQEDYLRIIFSKTASLFEASALSAAISVSAPQHIREAVTAYARNLGLAFQIRDDMFDYEADDAQVGKPVGIDLREQKITQPLLCALETVSEEEALQIRKKVAGILDHPEWVEEVHAFVVRQDGLSLSRKKLDFYTAEAISCLDILPESEEKRYLAKLARFVAERNK